MLIRYFHKLPLNYIHKKSILLFTEDKKDEVLKYKNKIFLGAIVPYIIFNGQLYSSGYLHIDFLNKVEKISLFSLNKPSNFFLSKSTKSLFVLFDGLSIYSDFFFSFISGLTKFLCVFGGGCGSKYYFNIPNIFFHGKFFKDVALVCELKDNFFINMFHGFKVKYASFSPTKISSYGREILEINYEPALEFYIRTLKNFENINTNFLSRKLYSSYPLGILSFKNGILVKDIIEIDYRKYSIKLASGIEKYEPMYLLHAEREDLIFEDMFFVRNLSLKNKNAFIFTCVSRKEILENKLLKEIEILSSKYENTFGFLSIGELTNFGLGQNIIHNKTNLIVGME